MRPAPALAGSSAATQTDETARILLGVYMNDLSKLFDTDAATVSMVGKSKSPRSLEARMPSREIAAKVGGPKISGGARMYRVVRRNAAV